MIDETIRKTWEAATGTLESECPWDVIGFARAILANESSQAVVILRKIVEEQFLSVVNLQAARKILDSQEYKSSSTAVFEIGFGWLDDPDKYPRGTKLFALPAIAPRGKA